MVENRSFLKNMKNDSLYKNAKHTRMFGKNKK
jgi:hypothetical protein